MRDWATLEPDRYRLLDKHYTPGRAGQKITKVVLHHNAGNLSIDSIWQVWQTREASAHYQVDQYGQVGQLVHDSDTAWHAGDWDVNVSSIGIEHANRTLIPPTIWDATLEEGAHLTAALCRFYQLGRPAWGVNVFGHSMFYSTSCPGSLAPGGSQHHTYMTRAQAWYDAMASASIPPPSEEEDEMSAEGEQRIIALLEDQGWKIQMILEAVAREGKEGFYHRGHLTEGQQDIRVGIEALLAREAGEAVPVEVDTSVVAEAARRGAGEGARRALDGATITAAKEAAE